MIGGVIGTMFALAVGIGIASGGKKKKSRSKKAAEPNANDVADAIAEAEARGEVAVTEEGEVIDLAPADDETSDLAAALAEAEARGEVAVTEEGEVIADDSTAESWSLPPNWCADFTLKPDGNAKALVKYLKSSASDVTNVTLNKGGTVSFRACDEEPAEIEYGSYLPDIPGQVIQISNIRQMTPKEQEEDTASELAEAEANGEIEVTDDGDVIEAEPEAVAPEEDEQVAEALAEAEANGEIEVTDDGDVIEAQPEPATGDLIETDQEAEELAELLTRAERDLGSLWKTAHQAEVQNWQDGETDYQGKPMVPDGKFGPKSALTIASKGVSVIPLVRFWPRGALQQTAVQEYKINLQQLKTADPEAVRVALARERGQGFGTARAIPPSEQAG